MRAQPFWPAMEAAVGVACLLLAGSAATGLMTGWPRDGARTHHGYPGAAAVPRARFHAAAGAGCLGRWPGGMNPVQSPPKMSDLLGIMTGLGN